MDGLEVEELFGFCAVAVTPPKKEVIIAQMMVKGESSSQRKELKSPPGKLTWGEKNSIVKILKIKSSSTHRGACFWQD